MTYSVVALVETLSAPCVSRDSEEAANQWARPLGVLTTALELSKAISLRIASVEAEILLNMGESNGKMIWP